MKEEITNIKLGGNVEENIKSAIEKRENTIRVNLEKGITKDKDYCSVCCGHLSEIRGRYPGDPDREVCPSCLLESVEQVIRDLYPNNVPTANS